MAACYRQERPGMDVLFSSLILAFAIPAWVPIIRNRQLWPKLRTPVITVTFSALLQLVFVNCVARGLFTLDYSLRFAAVGIPCSVLALVLRPKDTVTWRSRIGVILGSLLSLAMWLLLITLH
jgi:hypothetical protein